MAELTQGAFLPPPSNIGYARTPSKIGLIATLVQHYDTNELIFPSLINDFIQNEMRNKITVNELMSARGALKTFYIFDRALIGEGHLSEKGTYFKILKNRNSDF